MRFKAYVELEIPDPDWDDPDDTVFEDAQNEIESALKSTGYVVLDIEWK